MEHLGPGVRSPFDVELALQSAVKTTISLPPELARDTEALARAEGKSVSAVIQDALRMARRTRLRGQCAEIQEYWSRLARNRGPHSEQDLARYLRK